MSANANGTSSTPATIPIVACPVLEAQSQAPQQSTVNNAVTPTARSGIAERSYRAWAT
jgi:hypothetical protein